MAKKQNNKTASLPAQAVIKTLVVTPSRVDSADISTWKSALNNATRSGDRSKFYDLLDNVMLDGVLSSAVERRVNKITNAEITFQVKGRSVEEIDDLIDTPEFEDLIREIALSRAYGKSVIELGFHPEFSVFSFPRKNIKITNLEKPLSERKRFIAAKPGDRTGYDYTSDEFIIECGKDDDTGYIFKAAAYVIYKRGGFGDWAQYAEIFGMPFIWATYNSMDENQRDMLFEALSKIGSNPVAAVPEGANLNVHDVGGKSTDLFDKFKKACDDEILICVLGQTMTTSDGSSRSQAEVHQDTEEGIAQSDRRFVQRTLNKHLVPLLVKRGYPVQGGFFLFPDQGEDIPTKDRLDMAFRMRQEGIPVDDDYFYEITGIPKAEQGAPKPKDDKREDGEDHDDDDPSPEGSEPQPQEKESGLSDEDKGWFIKLFERFFPYAPTKKERGYKRGLWTRLTDSILGKITLADDHAIDIKKLLERALNEIYGNAEKGKDQPIVSTPLFEISNDALQDAIDSVFTPSFGEKNKEFVEEFSKNTAVFAAFKNHHQTGDLVALLLDEEGNLRSFREFKKLALKISKNYNERWLQTEYNTAVRAARSAVNYRKYLETKHLYPNLEYIRSTSAHPRTSHLAYVGTVLPIEHPWWDTHMPPSDWNCSCSVQPTDKELTPVPGEEFVNPVFQNNPGKSAEFLKLEEHPYVKGVCPYFSTCKRRTGEIGQGAQLSDEPINKENPPVIPECKICELAKAYRNNQKRIEENRKEYERLKNDPNYYDVQFNPKTGGLKARHIGHSFDKRKGGYEKRTQNIGFKYGRAVILEAEPGNIRYQRHTEGTWDGLLFEIGAAETATQNNIRDALKHCASKRTTEIAIVYFPNNNFDLSTFYDALRAYEGLKHKKDGQYLNFQKIFVVLKKGKILVIK